MSETLDTERRRFPWWVLVVDTGSDTYAISWYGDGARRTRTPGRPVAPSSDLDSAWFALDGLRRGSPIRPYDDRGAIGPVVRLPENAFLMRATPRGLLLNDGGTVRLWDPDTRTTVRIRPTG